MPQSLTQGFRYLQTFDKILEETGKLLKALNEQRAFNKDAKAFSQSMGGKEINPDNVALYATTQRNAEALQQALKDANIPALIAQHDKTGQTVVIAPKTYEMQANCIVGNMISPKQDKQGIPIPRKSQLSEIQQKYGHTFKPGNKHATIEATLATKPMHGIHAVEMPTNRAIVLADKLKEAGIPCAIRSAGGRSCIVFDETMVHQVAKAEAGLSKTKIPYHEFVKRNMNKEVTTIELSESQKDYVLRQCPHQGMCIEQSGPGKYKVMFPANNTRVQRAVNESFISKTSIDARSARDADLTRRILAEAKKGKLLHITNSQFPEQQLMIDKNGLYAKDGTKLMDSSNPAFTPTVLSAVSRNSSPICEEIAIAKGNMAKDNLDEAEMFASQIACFSGRPNAQVLSDIAATAKQNADAKEGEFTALDAGPLAEKMGINPSEMNEFTSLIGEYNEAAQKLSANERAELSNRTQAAMSAPTADKASHTRAVGPQDQSFDDINETLENDGNVPGVSDREAPAPETDVELDFNVFGE